MKRRTEPAVVEVHLYGALRCYGERRDVNSPSIARLEARSGETVGDALRQLGVRGGEVANVFRNGRLAAFEDALQPGDRLGVFPPTMAFLYC